MGVGIRNHSGQDSKSDKSPPVLVSRSLTNFALDLWRLRWHNTLNMIFQLFGAFLKVVCRLAPAVKQL